MRALRENQKEGSPACRGQRKGVNVKGREAWIGIRSGDKMKKSVLGSENGNERGSVGSWKS